MNRLAGYLGHLLLILAGYLCASVAASALLVAVFLSPFGWLPEELPFVLTGSIFVAVPVLTLFIAHFAFFPSLVAIFLIEALTLRDWLWNAIGGGTVALVVHQWNWQAEGPEMQAAPFLMALIAAGMVGGSAYWLIAGRASGQWREPPLPPPTQAEAER